MTTKTIILAKNLKTGAVSYLTGKRRYLSDDITDAALYTSETRALPVVASLWKEDFENKNDCVLSLGTLEFTLVAETPVSRKPVTPGWVVRREDGLYYAGPLTRDPKDWSEARYKFVANKDAATAFPSESIARTRADAILDILISGYSSPSSINNLNLTLEQR